MTVLAKKVNLIEKKSVFMKLLLVMNNGLESWYFYGNNHQTNKLKEYLSSILTVATAMSKIQNMKKIV